VVEKMSKSLRVCEYAGTGNRGFNQTLSGGWRRCTVSPVCLVVDRVSQPRSRDLRVRWRISRWERRERRWTGDDRRGKKDGRHEPGHLVRLVGTGRAGLVSPAVSHELAWSPLKESQNWRTLAPFWKPGWESLDFQCKLENAV